MADAWLIERGIVTGRESTEGNYTVWNARGISVLKIAVEAGFGVSLTWCSNFSHGLLCTSQNSHAPNFST
jgi:hypothetical protein